METIKPHDPTTVPPSEVVRFLRYLWGREAQSDAIGKLARHVKARGYEWTPEQRLLHEMETPRPGNFDWPAVSPQLNAISANYLHKWQDFEAIKISCRFHGPACSQSEFDTALATFRAS